MLRVILKSVATGALGLSIGIGGRGIADEKHSAYRRQ